jgi:hypothetical protein
MCLEQVNNIVVHSVSSDVLAKGSPDPLLGRRRSRGKDLSCRMELCSFSFFSSRRVRDLSAETTSLILRGPTPCSKEGLPCILDQGPICKPFCVSVERGGWKTAKFRRCAVNFLCFLLFNRKRPYLLLQKASKLSARSETKSRDTKAEE